jgi:hypothetical protein
MSQPIYLNEVFNFLDLAATGLEGLYRTLWVDQLHDRVHLIRICPMKPEKPFIYGLTDLQENLDDLTVTKTKHLIPQHMLTDENDISSKLKDARDRRMKIIATLVSTEGTKQIFEEKKLGKLVTKAAETHSVTRMDVYRLMYRYWHYGCSPNALLPDFHACGGKGSIRTPGNAKRGRPLDILKHSMIQADHQGVNVTEDDRKLFTTGWKKFAGENKSLREVYNDTMDTFYCEGYESNQGKQYPKRKEALLIPTFEQFRYWTNIQFDKITRLTKNTNPRTFNKDMRGLHGTSRDDVIGPGFCYQIDSTQANAYLVSSINRAWGIGRPTVFYVIDTNSGAIVGLHVGIEPPSWNNGARLALFNALTDKVTYCARFGVSISPEEWPCATIPVRIQSDRGEMLSENARSGTSGPLNIEQAIAASYRADQKGDVERMFGLSNHAAIKGIPGWVTPKGLERGENDYREDAVLTLSEFTKILIEHAIWYNNHADKTHYLTKEMLRDGITPNPISIWNWGMENGFGSLKTDSPQRIMTALLSTATASVRGNGIFFSNLRYESELAFNEQWTTMARNFGRRKINIKYNPNTMGEIYWLNPETSDYVTFTLREDQVIESNNWWEEHENLQVCRKFIEAENVNERNQARIRMQENRKQTVERAKQLQHDADPSLSKSSLKKNIKANRTLDIDLQNLCEQNKGVIPDTLLDEIFNTPSDSNPRLVDFILNKQKEDENE